MTKTDLIIIGSGPGGYRAAEYAARKGLQVTIIEAHDAGGTCLNSGCIPTKTLCKHAEVADTIRDAATYGIHLSSADFSIDMPTIIDRKQAIIDRLRQGVEQIMAMPGITYLKGKAHFSGNKTIVVNDQEITADNILIATGSTAKQLPIEGIDLPGVLTSTELLDLPRIPQRLCVIGAGVIGMEFASIYRSLGSEVCVVEYLKECLPALDSDIAKRLRKQLEQRGIDFYFQSAVSRIEKT